MQAEVPTVNVKLEPPENVSPNDELVALKTSVYCPACWAGTVHDALADPPPADRVPKFWTPPPVAPEKFSAARTLKAGRSPLFCTVHVTEKAVPVDMTPGALQAELN